jgi:uncharacterized membrane protein YoaK (UPF0700 family)
MSRTASIALLACSAGYVDALGYVALGGVFTSHATGNVSAIAIALVTGTGRGIALIRAVMVAAFAVGGALGTIVLEQRRSPTVALVLVALCLLAAAFGLREAAAGSTAAATDALVACLAIAMGIQNIALAQLGRRAHTTHITGPLTDLASDLTLRAVSRGGEVGDRTPLRVHAGRVCGFAAGAFVGAEAWVALGSAAPLLPAAAVVVASMLLEAP